jgi:dTDP-4-amino-4,6-dideoxyglucose formyltransferase
MKILVVIDNVIQYEKLKNIFLKYNDGSFEVHFKHSVVRSAIWDHPDFKNIQDRVVDVKKEIDSIISVYSLVFSVHCFQFFPSKLVNSVRCINVHPGYNPINRGWYPQVFSIIHNLPIGATIHEMDEKLDNGNIIARQFVETDISDTSLSIYNRVLEVEITLFEKYFWQMLQGTYVPIVPENAGNMFTKNDFNNLCKIDLDQQGTFLEFYNRLRALSHGDYKNAYLIDNTTGKKVFLKLDIEYE